ncbi:MAG: response regulator [Candidatus Hydrogenedentes bacterium]|nr:response regulator [Candidatus Hydrogenedentota bacterium]
MNKRHSRRNVDGENEKRINEQSMFSNSERSLKGSEPYYRVLLVQGNNSSSSKVFPLVAEHLAECHVDIASSIGDVFTYIKVFIPDCLIIDFCIGLKETLTLCRYWRTNPSTSRTPILLLLEDEVSTEQKLELLAGGVDDFLSSNCDTAEAMARIRVLIRTKQAEVGLWETNKKLLDLAEERSKALFIYDELNRFLIENSSDPILVFELSEEIGNSRFIDVNSVACLITNFTRDEFLSLRLKDIVPEDRIEGIYGRIESILKHQQVSFETVILTKDGRKVPVDVYARAFESDSMRYIVAIGKIMEDGTVSSEKVSESIARYRILAAQTGMLIYDCNLHTGKIKWGGAFTQVTGYSLRELELMHYPRWLNNIHPDDLPMVKSQVEKAKQEIGKFRIEYRLKHKNGEYKYVEDQGVILPDASGDAYRILGSIKDITVQKKEEEERRRAEQQIQHSQRLESLGVLAGGIAHDFNNLLAVIIGFTEMALNELPKKSPLYEDLSEVLQAANRARDLVRQILAFSRQTGEEISPIYLHVIAREVMKMLRATTPPNIEIIDNVSVHSGAIMGNPAQIHQVVINYCTNAIQAMPNGGKLEIEVKDVTLGKEASSIHPKLAPGAYVRLVVRDTGHGMEQHILERIFDPFFTTKKPGEGTGMGLAVVHGIVTAHGGTIVVESKPGLGSTFYTYFPRIDNPIITEKTIDEGSYSGNERILFVDDEESVCRLGKRILSQMGYQVEVYRNPLSALATFTKFPERFDLVVTDQAMPKMSGEVLAKWIKELRPDIPIILFTGFSSEWTQEELAKAGIDELVLKPIIARDLAKRIRKVLDKKKSS